MTDRSDACGAGSPVTWNERAVDEVKCFALGIFIALSLRSRLLHFVFVEVYGVNNELRDCGGLGQNRGGAAGGNFGIWSE